MNEVQFMEVMANEMLSRQDEIGALYRKVIDWLTSEVSKRAGVPSSQLSEETKSQIYGSGIIALTEASASMQRDLFESGGDEKDSDAHTPGTMVSGISAGDASFFVEVALVGSVLVVRLLDSKNISRTYLEFKPEEFGLTAP